MKINESGRSMIEMLGVLAIIGVLSVGGIAGYSKAMAKHKINKTVDQITQITASTRALFTGHKNYIALGANQDNQFKLIKKAHLVPDEMLELKADGTIDKILNAYAGNVTFAVADKKSGSGDNKAFKLTFTMIPMSPCIDLVTQDWGNRSTSGLIELQVNDSSDHKKNRFFTIGEAIAACTKKTDNSISWTFY
ncbi:MAG: hypothetical protein IKN71_09085 [Alphaproteobacteria bacterium]|nr:hypothetical protein [Alphaproteobacteria bacterium]